MVRHRQHMTITLGKFREALEWAEQVDQICAARGWKTGTFLTPLAGDGNVLIVETEYPDLATFESEMNAFQADAEAMTIFRRGVEFNAAGQWPHEELLVESPHLAASLS